MIDIKSYFDTLKALTLVREYAKAQIDESRKHGMGEPREKRIKDSFHLNFVFFMFKNVILLL